MTQKFLKAKHWQLFLLTFGVAFTFQIIMMVSLFSNISKGNHLDPSFMFGFVKFYPIVLLIVLGVFFGWFWSVATGLQKFIPAEVQLNLKRFKVFFFIPMVYMLFMGVFLSVAMNGVFEGSSAPSAGLVGGMLAIIVPLHLFSIFCIFYSLYFVAKTFKTAELQRTVTFSDFAGEFFLIWFFPIGIWIMQPKINRMVNGEREEF